MTVLPSRLAIVLAVSAFVLAPPAASGDDARPPTLGSANFTYRFTYREDSKDLDNRPGASRHHMDLTREVSGQIELAIDNDYMNPPFNNIPFGYDIPVSPTSVEGHVTSYSIGAIVSGKETLWHYTMNTFGPPAPKWVHELEADTQGRCNASWDGTGVGGIGNFPLLGIRLGFVWQNPETKLLFGVDSECPTAVKRRTQEMGDRGEIRPPKEETRHRDESIGAGINTDPAVFRQERLDHR